MLFPYPTSVSLILRISEATPGTPCICGRNVGDRADNLLPGPFAAHAQLLEMRSQLWVTFLDRHEPCSSEVQRHELQQVVFVECFRGRDLWSAQRGTK